MINLALTYKRIGEHNKALQCLENGLKIHSRCADIYTNIGTIYYGQDKFEDAIVNYLKALEIEPEGMNFKTNYQMKRHYQIWQQS
jgi:tetratricopeptide (TPR) repeat protein